jgi:hypothetical protein
MAPLVRAVVVEAEEQEELHQQEQEQKLVMVEHTVEAVAVDQLAIALDVAQEVAELFVLYGPETLANSHQLA